MIFYLLSKFITIFFGMLYPAYASYKAIKTKDAKEYVQWMMYWIVFAVYSVVEIFSDTFIGCWFPFYYELKILFMFWMLSPTTRGGSTLYRTFIHPTLNKHEKEIDGYLADAKIRTGNMVTSWGSRALSYVSDSFVRIVLRSERPSSLEFNNNGACANTLLQLRGSDEADNERFVHSASETLLVHTPLEHQQAPHMSMEYFLDNPQQRPGRMAGHHDYGRIPNQGNGYDQADDGRRYSNGPEMDDYDNFSDAGVPLNYRGPIEKDPLYIPPAGVRKEAQITKKMRNEFGNFSMVTASEENVPSRPVVFGWSYPFSQSSESSPSVPSAVVSSTFPSIIPAMANTTTPTTITSPETVVLDSSASPISNSSNNDQTAENDFLSSKEVFVSAEEQKEESSDQDFFDCEESEKKKDLGKEKVMEKAAVGSTIKVVSKTNLQGFNEASGGAAGENTNSKDEKELANKAGVTVVRRMSSSSESLVAVKRKTASLTSLSKLDKTKARKSFSGTESKPSLFSTQSFRRVLHPFVSSKPLTSSQSSKNVSRSTTSLSTQKKKTEKAPTT